MKDQELIDKYLANGGIVTKVAQIFEPIEVKPTKLRKTETIQYLPNGKRKYKYLGKTLNILPIDQTMLNYGE